MANFALVGGRIIDPSSGLDTLGGVLVRDGVIEGIGSQVGGENLSKEIGIIDVSGLIVAPGLIDAQVHVGEPGQEHRETVKSVGVAAAAGGVTTIVTQPNTTPVIDSAAMVKLMQDRGEDSLVNVAPMAAITSGSKGEKLANIGTLFEAGAVALTDTPNYIRDARLMRQALLYAKTFDALLVQHVEDTALAADGVMHEGAMANDLGLPGIPAVAETVALARDLILARSVGGRYHAAALSSVDSLPMLRQMRQSDCQVSAGVQVAHLLLCDTDIETYYTFRKLSPPLRTEKDSSGLRQAVSEGLIEVITSGHNPQAAETKRQPFVDAAAGAVGVETLLPAILGLHLNHGMDLLTLIAAVTSGPARVLGIDAGSIRVGAPADLVVFDLSTQWKLSRAELSSRSKNTCFDKWDFTGLVHRTFVAGREIYNRSQIGNN